MKTNCRAANRARLDAFISTEAARLLSADRERAIAVLTASVGKSRGERAVMLGRA